MTNDDVTIVSYGARRVIAGWGAVVLVWLQQ